MSNSRRCIAHNDFVMCLTQYLFFLFISYLFSVYTYTYYTEEDSVKSKCLLSSNFLSLFILINLTLYNNQLMLVRWLSYFSLLCIIRAVSNFIYFLKIIIQILALVLSLWKTIKLFPNYYFKTIKKVTMLQELPISVYTYNMIYNDNLVHLPMN